MKKWSEMTPRERDALVAERVMGLEVDKDGLAAYPKYWLPEFDHTYLRDVPKYTTDISAAWEVVEKMKRDGWEPEIFYSQHGYPWTVSMDALNKHTARGDSAPETICLASLRAVGVDV